MNPTAQNIQDQIGCSDLEAEFAELVLWYDGFKDANRLAVLVLFPDDLAVVTAKRDDARMDKDYKTADFLRDVLEQCGVKVRDRQS